MNLKEFMDTAFPEEAERRKAGRCPFCNKTINSDDFRDEISSREFNISGLCQECQDNTFNDGGD